MQRRRPSDETLVALRGKLEDLPARSSERQHLMHGCAELHGVSMEIWPDLFGRALLLRQWGRIGTEGRRRLDPHPDPGAALNAC